MVTRITSDTPNWRGICPGQTTRAEVIQAFGQPSVIQTHADLELLSYYPRGWQSFVYQTDDYRILLCKGIVQLIIAGELGNPEEITTLTEVVQRIGAYDTVIEHGGYYPNVYVFAARGLAVVSFGGDIFASNIFASEHFVPMSVEDYRTHWGRFHPRDTPFPISFPGHPMDVGIVPDQSRKEDILRIYGEPDYVGPMDRWGYPPGYDPARDKVEVLSYRVPQHVQWDNPLGGPALVNFILDGNKVVRLVHLWGSLQPGHTLGDVFANYGEPRWMYRRQTGPWSEFADTPTSYFYPEKGFSVQATGYRNIKPTDQIQSEWFYKPMTWDEYWSSWGAQPRIGWSGREAQFAGELTEWTGFPDNK